MKSLKGLIWPQDGITEEIWKYQKGDKCQEGQEQGQLAKQRRHNSEGLDNGSSRRWLQLCQRGGIYPWLVEVRSLQLAGLILILSSGTSGCPPVSNIRRLSPEEQIRHNAVRSYGNLVSEYKAQLPGQNIKKVCKSTFYQRRRESDLTMY